MQRMAEHALAAEPDARASRIALLAPSQPTR